MLRFRYHPSSPETFRCHVFGMMLRIRHSFVIQRKDRGAKIFLFQSLPCLDGLSSKTSKLSLKNSIQLPLKHMVFGKTSRAHPTLSDHFPRVSDRYFTEHFGWLLLQLQNFQQYLYMNTYSTTTNLICL